MPKKTIPQTEPPPDLAQVRASAAADQALIRTVSVTVTDESSYAKADAALGIVLDKVKEYKSLFERINKPLREAVAASREAKDTVLKPWEQAEDLLRSEMNRYKREEAYRIAQEQELKAKEQQRLIAEAQAKQVRAEQVKSQALASRLQNEAAQSVLKAAEVQASVPKPVQATNTTTRKTVVWECVDLALVIQAVSEGRLPEEAVLINSAWLTQKLREDRAYVESILGIKVRDEVTVVKK